MNAQDILKNAQTLVIKIGSALLIDPQKSGVDYAWIESFAQDLKTLADQGKRLVVVTSGSIALGRQALGIPWDTRPGDIKLKQKQAASAVGQPRLFNAYYHAFKHQNLTAAQVLLTLLETENRRMHLNARETLHALLDHHTIPIINENDTISTEEMRFGDNDRLAARVGLMIDADCVILLSTAQGLFDKDPNLHKDAKLIPFVENITDEHIDMAGEAAAGVSTGGMKSKMQAAITATRGGTDMIIASGESNHALADLLNDPATPCTIFAGHKSSFNARKRWIEGHVNPKGSLFVDEGALAAMKGGKSLLPIGVVRVEGTFERGDAVYIRTRQGFEVGIGLAAYNSEDAKKIAGRQSAEFRSLLGYDGRDELVHRNNMVLSD